jgi:hypothetical protein
LGEAAAFSGSAATLIARNAWPRHFAAAVNPARLRWKIEVRVRIAMKLAR